ncbi:helix-turn-helix domain-containing protein [Niveibacterium sp.]|uniref:helix-turn-helix domain-containing protein n=1 Tax=Niveibacterium sp. TaxID=2017444 RepID=UPI0035B25D7E
MDFDAALSARVRALRKARGFTLDQLADLSGVSRSMISLIERQETSPTAAVLNKLADALGVSLPTLLAPDSPSPAPQPVARAADQPVWTDPGSGYVRRQLSPAGWPSPIELVELRFPAGQRVSFDNPTRSIAIHQQLWLLEGAMEITAGNQLWQLEAGDCLAMTLGDRVVFHNPGKQDARYLLALSTSAPQPTPTTRAAP